MFLIDHHTFLSIQHDEKSSILTFSFVLTTIDSKWRFGFCRHDRRSNTAMVVLTYLPWNDVFTRFINVLGEIRTTDHPDEFMQFLREAYVSVPEPGASLKLYYKSGVRVECFNLNVNYMK